MNETNPAPPTIPRNRLLMATAGAAIAAGLILVCAVLPAEFNVDPLGVGRLTGVSRLWAPAEREVGAGEAAAPLAREFQTPYRTDVVEIPLGGFLTGADNSELEYKVRMRKGETLTYAWEVTGAGRPEDFRFDHHGHTVPPPGQAMEVATYRRGAGLRLAGALTAPFDGIHGWQFSNSGDEPVVVRLRLSGFYELIPAGQPGNEAAVIANVPATAARPNAPAALKAAP